MESTIEETLDAIIESALRARASDIHIDPTEKMLSVSFRIDGGLSFYKEFPMSMHEGIVLRIKVMARLPIDDKRQPKDGRFKWQNSEGTLSAEIRVSMMPTRYGENIVLRIFDPLISILSLKDLGFSDTNIFSLERALAMRSGLIIVVGPTGSGKTTTLYSILSLLQTSSRLIVTVEDPIERHVEGLRQIEVGGNTLLEYVTVLRSILRQDPDIIMIGEIRDKEGAELAIQSALTGHLVITTLHAASAFQVKKRLMNMDVAEYLIDATLVCALAQRLVSKICLECKQEDTDTDSYKNWFIKEGVDISSVVLHKGAGCFSCGGRGVKGRMVISETLEEGQSLKMDAYHKASLGLIPFLEVINMSRDYHAVF